MTAEDGESSSALWDTSDHLHDVCVQTDWNTSCPHVWLLHWTAAGFVQQRGTKWRILKYKSMNWLRQCWMCECTHESLIYSRFTADIFQSTTQLSSLSITRFLWKWASMRVNPSQGSESFCIPLLLYFCFFIQPLIFFKTQISWFIFCKIYHHMFTYR